jgi:hypothetical protein
MTHRIVLAGSSGLIGRALETELQARGAEVYHLVRRDPRTKNEQRWSPERGEIDEATLAGVDAVISLNGASVGHLPWTKSYRRLLRDSRIDATRTIATAVSRLGSEAPRAWLSASAVGFYGDRPAEVLTESSAAGDTFLARLCVEWEAEALTAAADRIGHGSRCPTRCGAFCMR